ncbi:MAG: hypothetical protein Kow00108_01440 [Calditrichia bacterium]
MKTVAKKVATLLIVLFAVMFVFQGCVPPEIESTKLYLQKKQYDHAEEQARLAVEKYPANPMGYFYLGKVLYEKGDFKGMVEAFNKAKELKLDAKNAAEADKYIKSSFAQNYNAAVKYVNQAQSIDDSVKQLELFKEAYEFAYNAYYCDPNYFPTYNILFRLGIQLGKKDEAHKLMKESVQKFGDNDTLLYYVGIGYLSLGENNEAEEIFKKAHDINPANSEVIKALVDIYVERSDFQHAQELLKTLVEKEPENPQILYLAAATFYNQKQYTEAAIYFEKLVQLVPDNKDYLEFYAIALIQSNQASKAAEVLEANMSKFENDPDIWQQYAVALLKAGRVDDAKKANAKAKELRGE